MWDGTLFSLISNLVVWYLKYHTNKEIFMGGSGGGAAGTVSYPAYIQTFHERILDNTGTDSPSSSFVDAFNVAYNNSPFATAVSFNPTSDIAAALSGVTNFANFVITLNPFTDFSTGVSTSRSLFPQGTTPLRSVTYVAPGIPYIPPNYILNNTPSVLDITTLDTANVNEADINAAIAAMDAILTTQLEEEELPKFRAGMLNINAIHSSAYIIGEALLRASKDRALAKHGTDLQIEIAKQTQEINARHAISYREITARNQQSFRELNSRDATATKDMNLRYVITAGEIVSKHQELYREDVLRLQLSKGELDARYQISKDEIDAKFYIHREELVRLSTTTMLADLMKKADLTYQNAVVNADIRRFAIVAQKESAEEQLAIDESDAKWNLDLFRYSGIVLAGPAGGVAQGNDRKSRAISAIGGAISGASAGAVAGAAFGGVGAPVGAAIGAVAGVGLAMLG
jgi:hypothetical protein